MFKREYFLGVFNVIAFKLEVLENSVTFPYSNKEGLLSVTVVNSSKIPIASPNGMPLQFIVAVQATDAMFEPSVCISDGQGKVIVNLYAHYIFNELFSNASFVSAIAESKKG